jgi:hypothetical protein
VACFFMVRRYIEMSNLGAQFIEPKGLDESSPYNRRLVTATS